MKSIQSIVGVLFALAVFGCACSSATSGGGGSSGGSVTIRANQVAYYPKAAKEFAAIGTSETTFSIVDASGNVQHTGNLVDKGTWSASGEKVKLGDFTAFQSTGTFKIQVGSTQSSSFTIDSTTLKTVAKDLTKFYYFQRASVAIVGTYAGIYARSLGHADTSATYHSTAKSGGGTANVTGGWYDAGDYGKYIVNGGISVATLMGLFETFGDVTGDTDTNIPESSNGQSDLLDEIKYELDWFKRMQDSDGGVFFKVASTTWANGWTMPASDPNTRYIIGKSTTSTLNFAAVMAQASRVFQSYDATYASDCLTRAGNAWTWAKNNPSVAYPTANGANDGSGAYNDSTYTDEFIWAACELYIANGAAEYKNYIDTNLTSMTISGPADWGNVRNLGIFSLSVKGSGSYKTNAQSAVTTFADTILSRIASNPYAIPMQDSDFGWGSSGGLGNYGVILAYAYSATNQSKYLTGMSRIANYLLGKNATGYSLITGYGSNRAVNPHHRISANDSIAAPIPGMVIGGPNPGQEDDVTTYPSALPAKSYVDHVDAYAANEVTVNWNAPAAMVFWVLEKYKASM